MGESETTLLRGAVDGDHDAMASLLRRHAAGVEARLAQRIAPHWQSVLSADDVMQVTHLKAFLGIGDRKPSTDDAFRNWLWKMAENNLRDAIRGLEASRRPDPRRRVVHQTDDESFAALHTLVGATHSTPSRAASRKEANAALAEALRKIPEDYRRVIQRYDLEGWPIETIATSMNRSTGAIFMLRARALERLRGRMGGRSKLLSDSA